MAMNVFDRVMGRVYGVGDVDGYGSQIVEYTATAQEVNLGINELYEFTASRDGYLSMLDLDAGDSSVTDATGVKFFATTGNHDKFYMMTRKNMHVLSVKRPDGTSDHGELRVVLKKPQSDAR